MFAFAGQKQAAQRRLHAQGRKVIPADIAADKMIGFVVGAHASQSHFGGKQLGEGVCLFPKIEQFGIGEEVNAERGTLLLRCEYGNLRWLRHWQWQENESVPSTQDADIGG